MDRGTVILQKRIRALRARQAAAILRLGWRDVAGARQGLELLRESLKTPGPGRRCLLDSPLLGGWLQDMLFWRKALDRAAALRRGHSTSAMNRLFEQIARTEYLLEIVPAGAVDSQVPRRVHRRARAVLSQRIEDLPRILWPHLPGAAGGPVVLRAQENPDEGMPSGRVRLGMTPAVLWEAGATGGKPIVASLRRGCLILPPRVKLDLHETVPESSILLAHRLLSASRALRVGGKVPGLGARLARGLALLRRAWPEAEEEVRRRTWLIVPLVEPGTVSYSHLARPGISYLNVFRGSLVDLADDLLHETAHHRLHAWQETIRFSTLDDERRYFSPWRRALRPLNGILHGTYTFLFRAELLLRLSRDAAPSSARRRALRREAAIEMRHCRMALADLGRAGQGGELTGHGRQLVRSMARRLRFLRAGRLSGRFEIGIF